MEIAIYCRSGARSGATQKSGEAERSGERALQENDGAERSGARSGGSLSGNGAGSGGYRIRLERGAAFSPAPLRSHALAMTKKAVSFFGRKNRVTPSVAALGDTNPNDASGIDSAVPAIAKKFSAIRHH